MTNVSLLMETAERLAAQFNASQSRLSTCDTQLICEVDFDSIGAELIFYSAGFSAIIEPEKVFDFLAKNAPNLSVVIRYSEFRNKVTILAF